MATNGSMVFRNERLCSSNERTTNLVGANVVAVAVWQVVVDMMKLDILAMTTFVKATEPQDDDSYCSLVLTRRENGTEDTCSRAVVF
mmetsp:Transcript_109483/g.163691  ORF Transcript_109483/g.163691 Transcript_109483/m.163691 type:complete len:87 (+) Transcript_109483:299-559(+)